MSGTGWGWLGLLWDTQTGTRPLLMIYSVSQSLARSVSPVCRVSAHGLPPVFFYRWEYSILLHTMLKMPSLCIAQFAPPYHLIVRTPIGIALSDRLKAGAGRDTEA